MVLALLSALFAALVGVVGKRGLEGIDPTLATAIRAVIMAGFLVGAAASLGKLGGLREVSKPALGWIALSGFCGAASWLCYFWALREGPAGQVAVLDRLSVVLTLLLAALILKERLTAGAAAGGALMVLGAMLVLQAK
jgi:transporter family protein